MQYLQVCPRLKELTVCDSLVTWSLATDWQQVAADTLTSDDLRLFFKSEKRKPFSTLRACR